MIGGGSNVTTQTSQVRPGPGFDRVNDALYGQLRAVNSDFTAAREGMFDAARGGGAVNQNYNALYGAADPTANLGLLNQTAQGAYLYNNPTLDPVFNSMATQIGEQYANFGAPSLHSSASQARRFGSGADALLRAEADKNYKRALSDLANQVYYQDYSRERQNQLGAQQGLAGYGQGILGNQANYQLGAYQAAGNPYLEYAGGVAPMIGQDITSTERARRNPSMGSTLGTLGTLATGIALAPATGGTSLAATAPSAINGLFGPVY